MNKKNKVLLVLVCIVVGLVPPACKKGFLEQTNRSNATVDATFQKSGDVVALVNSIYDGYQNSDLLKKSIWYYANFQTHDWFNYGNDVIWNYYAIPADFYALPAFWDNAYISIARANAAFGVIEKAKTEGVVTADLANRLTGEAYFLRGMSYYYLAGTFGGVPLELDPLTNGLTPRSSQDSVFKQVISDMDKAIALLPWKTDLPASELGRATKGSAIGYKGSAQMWVKDYAGALASFNLLNGKYSLLPNFVDVHEYNKQNNDESLFEIQFTVPAGMSQSWDGGWQNGGEVAWIDDFSWPEEVSNFGYDYGNPGLWYSYQAGDRRKLATIVGPDDALVSPGIIGRGGIKSYPLVISGFASTNATEKARYTGSDGNIINTVGTAARPWFGKSDEKRSGYYCAKKWRDPTLTGNSGNQTIFGAQNQILLRYAEILLSRAECKVRLNDIPGAMADLKLVRDRAWGGTAPAVMQDGLNWNGTPSTPITDPLQMVLSEYRHELSADYSLFYLLRRAGKDGSGNSIAAEFIKKAYGTDNTTTPQPYPFGPTADGKPHGVWRTSLPANRDVLPIPQKARGLNPNLTQNPGY
jgi:starch-binding outer membrane protein, SusD/RagB family